LHNHAIDAVTALCRLFGNEGFLNWVEFLRSAQSFQGDYFFACHR
jgi:hypothetical protein